MNTRTCVYMNVDVFDRVDGRVPVLLNIYGVASNPNLSLSVLS